MDNIIKIYLRQTGAIAELSKTIPLYVGMYNTAILDVYVPESLLDENISVKVGAILTANDGTKATTNSLPMTFKENKTVYGQNYAVYEINPFPSTFLSYAGIQDIIVNIVTLDDEEVESVVTTQIAQIDVLDSSFIPDEDINPTAVDLLNARITTNEQNIATNTQDITANSNQIEQNTQDISSNSQRIAELEETMSTGEDYIGSLQTNTLVGINTVLDTFVLEQESREPENGDVVIVTLILTGQTDEIYKYFYSASGWQNYKMPSIESASNTDKGILQGTLGQNLNTQVDIVGGQVNNIYVKDSNGTLRNVREYLNTNKAGIDNIVSGQTKVGYALKTDKDANGNDIVTTYLTQNAGVTKQQMREYALPREFNDVYYLGQNVLQNTKPTSSVQYDTEISDIGTFALLSVTLQTTATFELSSKNSCQNVFYISASEDVTCSFRLDTTYGENIPMSTEISNQFVMNANTVYKVQFNSNFNDLTDAVSFANGTPVIAQKLSIISTDTTQKTFSVYSNATYLSTFNLNTNNYTIAVESGYLGEIPNIVATGTIQNGVATFEISQELKDNTLVRFDLTFTGTDNTTYIKFVDEQTTEEIAIQTPYNEQRPQVKDFEQCSVVTESGTTKITFVGLVDTIEGYGTKIIVNEDNLTAIKNTIAGKQDALTTTQMNAVNSGINSTKVEQIETNKNDIATINGKIPSQASSSNQLADKDYVSDAINQFSAYYITKNAQGEPFSTKAELNNATVFYSGGVVRVPTTNDYCIVLADESKQSATGVDPTTRYSYQGNQWEYQYTVNDTPLTAQQLLALNSGITSSLVAQIGTNQTNITNLSNNKVDKTTKINGKSLTGDVTLDADDISDSGTTNKFVTSGEKNTWNGKQDQLQSGVNIKTLNGNSILGSGDLTVGGGQSTDVQVDSNSITQGDVANLHTINGDYNASTNKLATEDDLPTKTSDLQNDSGYITSSDIPITEDITEMSTQDIYIYNLSVGLYKLTYNGTKILHFTSDANTNESYSSLSYLRVLSIDNQDRVYMFCPTNELKIHYGICSLTNIAKNTLDLSFSCQQVLLDTNIAGKILMSTTTKGLGLWQSCSTTPTSGSDIPITSGAVADALATVKTYMDKKTSGAKTPAVSLGSNKGAYTPTASGFIVARASGYNDGNYARISLGTGTTDVLASNLQYTSTSRGYNPCSTLIVPVCKGQTYYLISSSAYTFYFYPDAGGDLTW